MQDNKTSRPAQEYDANVSKTIPYYGLFHDETIDLVKAVHPCPSVWLDAGCGTGSLIAKASGVFADTRFILADPSPAMLALAKEKLAGNGNTAYMLAGSEELNCPRDSLDVMTAILAHHYLNQAARMQATAQCFAMLKPGGLYITFETVLPYSGKGTQVGLERWRNAQIERGKSPEAAERHISRFGTELQPISATEHCRLLRQTGFSVVELLWVSYMQAGFYAIK